MANNQDIIGIIHLDRMLLGRWPTPRELRRDIRLLAAFDRDVERQTATRARAQQITEE